MQSSSPKRIILEKRGSMVIKQPNDSPTISPAQLLKRNTLDSIEPTPLELKIMPVQSSNQKKGNLIAEGLDDDDITYIGAVPKIEQKKVQEQNKEIQLKKVQEISDSQSPTKSMSISQLSSPYPSVIQDFTFSQSAAFLTSPFQFAGIVQCSFVINKSGFNTFRPKFYLIKNDECYLSAKKIGEKYIICTDKDNIERKHQSFVGQVSCKKNSKYYFYDTGLNPKRKKEPYRKSLGELYFVNCPKQNEPRQQYFTFPDTNKQFCNRSPKWDQKLQTHTLNFFDRVKLSSIKNFQLILKDEQPEKIYLQMGKWSKHNFNLDIAAPFCPLIAFMIALCNYDQKLQV